MKNKKAMQSLVAIFTLVLCLITFAVSVTALVLGSVEIARPAPEFLPANGFFVVDSAITLDPQISHLLAGSGPGVVASVNSQIISSSLTGYDPVIGDISENDPILTGINKLSANSIAIVSDAPLAVLTNFSPSSGVLNAADSIILGLEKLDGNTPFLVAANGFAASTGPNWQVTLDPPIIGLVSGNSIELKQASDVDVTSAVLTGFVSGSGVLSATNSLLTAVEKLDGNPVAPVVQVSNVVASSSLVLDANADIIFIDTSNSAALCTLPIPNFSHIIKIQLKNQRGLSAEIQTASGGSFVLNSTTSFIQLYYLNAWRIVTSATLTRSFFPNTLGIQKIVPTGNIGNAHIGDSLQISADGLTVAVGGPTDNTDIGAVWIWVLNSFTWSQQAKLVGSNAVGSLQRVIAMSADGSTVVIGGSSDNSGIGHVWIFVRVGVVWSMEADIIPSPSVTNAGASGAISADGNILAFGAPLDSSSNGAVWIFARSETKWNLSQKILGSGGQQLGVSCQMSSDGTVLVVGHGASVPIAVYSNISGSYALINPPSSVGGNSTFTNLSLNANGRTLAVGNPTASSNVGSVAVFTFANNNWTQETALVGLGGSGFPQQGTATVLSADGNTLIISGPFDNSTAGTCWVFRRLNGNWQQVGPKIVGPTAIGAAKQGGSLGISSDGHILGIGGPLDNSGFGAFWMCY
jgi:hypothetical protein